TCARWPREFSTSPTTSRNVASGGGLVMVQTLDELKERLCRKVDAERAALIDLGDRIHANPELRFEEHRAASWLADYLEGAGFEVERGAYGLPTAVAARAGRGRPSV